MLVAVRDGLLGGGACPCADQPAAGVLTGAVCVHEPAVASGLPVDYEIAFIDGGEIELRFAELLELIS